MLTVKLDQKPQVIQDLGLTPVSPKTVDEVLTTEQVTEDFLNDIKNALSILIQDVGDLDKTDNIIKAIGKLKGALELLS